MSNLRTALQVLADAAGKVITDYAESDEVRRQELRERLAEAEDGARDALLDDEAARSTAAPVERRRRIQIVVDYFNGTTGYYVVPLGSGWKVDPAQRTLVIGSGVPRQLIPLDNVAAFSLTGYFEEVMS